MADDERSGGKWAAEAYDFLRLYRRLQGKIYGLVLLQFAWVGLLAFVEMLGPPDVETILPLPSIGTDATGRVSLGMADWTISEVYVAGAALIFLVWLVVSRVYLLAWRPVLRLIRGIAGTVVTAFAFVLVVASLPALLYTRPRYRRLAERALQELAKRKRDELVAEHGEEKAREIAAGAAGLTRDPVQTAIASLWRRAMSAFVPDVTIGLAQIESYSIDEERMAARLPQQIFSNAALRLQDQMDRWASGFKLEIMTVPEFLRARSADGAGRTRAWLGFDALLWGTFESSGADRIWVNISGHRPGDAEKDGTVIMEKPMSPFQTGSYGPHTLVVDAKAADDAYIALLMALDGAIAGRKRRRLADFLPDHWVKWEYSLGKLIRRLIAEAPHATWLDQTPTGTDLARTRLVELLHDWLSARANGFKSEESPELAAPVAEMAEGGDEVGIGPIMRIRDLRRAARPASRLVELLAEQVGEPAVGHECPAERVVRTEIDGGLEAADRLIKPPLVGERVPEPAVAKRQAGVQAERLLERVDGDLVLAPGARRRRSARWSSAKVIEVPPRGSEARRHLAADDSAVGGKWQPPPPAPGAQLQARAGGRMACQAVAVW